jgi:purine-binding chemotaxis protein CheW
MSAPEQGDAAGRRTFGLLRMAGAEVAVPVEALREVVPCPAEIAGLPARADGLLGAITIRHLVVPVLDVRDRLGLPSARDGERVVVLVAHEEHTLGLLADGTGDVATVPAGALQPVRAGGDGLLLSAVFQHPADGQVVSVLDVATLLTLPGVPTVHAPARAAARPSAATDGPAGRASRTLTLVRCAGRTLGLDVADVHTTLATSAAAPSALDGPLCHGVTTYRGREVAVIDPLALLGLGRMPAHETAAGLVLELPDGYVVLALSALVGIVDVPTDAILPLAAFAVRRPDLVVGLADVDGTGECLVLDGRALLADEGLGTFAAMNTAVGGGEPTGRAPATARAADRVGIDLGALAGALDPDAVVTTDPRGGRAELVYSLGDNVATPLAQISEVVGVPRTLTATDRGGAALGVSVHRGAAVVVLCLRTLLGLPAPADVTTSCLLLVEADGEHFGFAVDELRTLEPVSWEQAERPPAPEVLDPAGALRDAPLVSVGGAPGLLPELDLRAIARAVRTAMDTDARALAPA